MATKQIFVNLPVKDLDKTKAFFAALGYTFNPQFTDANAACMVVQKDSIHVMLLVEPFFKTFTTKAIADTGKTTEVLLCLSCESRAEVDDLVAKAKAAGGTIPREPQDYGFMPLGFPWETADPFLFCAYHDDAYPRGNGAMGPAVSLAGATSARTSAARTAGACTTATACRAFPAHPHRGFETVTIVRKGLIDHSDSLGATARFGGGDVQWVTAGRGIVHSEMFPLLKDRRGQPAGAVPDLAEPAPAQQDGRAALHHAVERAGAAPRAHRRRRPQAPRSR
jgi:predicted lactoylglutathione lyase